MSGLAGEEKYLGDDSIGFDLHTRTVLGAFRSHNVENFIDPAIVPEPEVQTFPDPSWPVNQEIPANLACCDTGDRRCNPVDVCSSCCSKFSSSKDSEGCSWRTLDIR